MSIYYKQEFVSPGPLFAEVKDDLSSYFNSGLIDDMMFPRWLDHCLKRFRKSAKRIDEVILEVEDYEAKLPEDFDGVREAWMCTTVNSDWIQNPTSVYYQRDCRIGTTEDSCSPCFDLDNGCDLTYMVTHKVTNMFMFSFKHSCLLTPGNMNARSKCEQGCKNLYSQGPHTFDIVGNRFRVNYSEGKVHLTYYSNAMEDGEQLVPDNFWVQDYIRKFLTYKCFERLSNTVVDESFNQIQLKKQEADQKQAEAFILAETELKKQTTEERIRQIGVSYRRNRKYRL